MGKPTWVVDIDKAVRSDGSSSVPEWKHSIYKVPSYVTALKEKAYKPVMVSFGPYHNGKESLNDMEAHKHRALIHFLKRCNKSIDLIYDRMEQVVQELINSYNPLDDTWIEDKQKFLKMMIVDGCFMLEILRGTDYADNDPVFGKHGKVYVVPFIQRDMLMLENQLPLRVLHILIQVETDNNQEKEELKLVKQIFEFFDKGKADPQKIGKCMHVLDVFRKCMIEQGLTNETIVPKGKWVKWWGRLRGHKEHDEEEEDEDIIRSATELSEAGITFRKSKTNSLSDVSFAHGVLWLPTLNVDDTTEYLFLNLIAFERLHVGAGNQVTSYVCFMDRIIDTEMDVALLHKKGILINNLGSDKDVAKMFNSLTTEVSLDVEGELHVVRNALSNYYRFKPWKKWKANLKQTYFRNPWAIFSLIAAIFLFALTLVQTGYTVAQYYQPDDS